MKKIKKILFLLFFIFPLYLSADSWDNLTYEQAEETCEFLSANPYILDYCDCCDFEGQYATKIYLMCVTSTEIIPCDWDSEYYSIKSDVKVLAEIPYTKDGPAMDNPQRYESSNELIITMNYTWAFNENALKAAPLYTIISYDIYGEQKSNSGYCRDFTPFPKPNTLKNKDYKNWYKNNF